MWCYRITAAHRVDGLSGEGAKRYGARFNPLGTSMLYLASSEALAMLEVRVHTREPDVIPRLLHIIDVNDDAVKSLDDLNLVLPQGWDAIPSDSVSAAFGKSWVDSQASLALLVPSVVARESNNLLVNVNHPDFGHSVKLVESRNVRLDGRLWSAPAQGSNS